MKKLFTLFTMLSLCIASTWAQYYKPVRRVTTFESGKSYMLYNTCVPDGDNRTGFIYVNTDNAMQKNVGTRRNPKQFTTASTAYLWRVTTGSDNHVALKNVSNNKYYGWELNANAEDPGNLYLYQWGTLPPAKQSKVKSQNEDDPTQSTASSAVTFADNKVFVIGGTGDGNKYWNGNPGDIVKWSTGHPFAFYEVETIDIPSGYNVYTGASTTLNQSGWQTQSNWSPTNTWNSNGPGTSGSGMWNPIYLNGVTASGITFEGWNLRIKLVNSSLTATTKKLQAQNVTSQFDVDQDSKLDLTLQSPSTPEEGNDPNTHTFNIDGSLTIKTVSGHFAGSSDNTVNLGTTGSFTFKADDAVTIGTNAPFTLNATLSDPSAQNAEESRTLATFTKVTVSSLTVNVNGTGGWTRVDSREALKTQTSQGKYYYVDQASSTGATLYTFHETRNRYIVTSDATLSEIPDYQSYGGFIVNSGVTLTVDVDDYDLKKITGGGNIILNANAPISGGTVSGSLTVNEVKTLTVNVENFDLTRISGAGNVVLNANASLTDSKETVATGKLTVNAGKTLTIGSGQSQTNSVASFTSIDLLGEIYHKNKKATLNKVTVPAGATGIIYSYDMDSDEDGFLLAGTTTVEGTLFVCNKWNFQMKVDKLTGNGTWTICGTTANDFDADGTSSTDAATINVASATSFTGTVNMNSTNATTKVNGTFMAGSGKLAGSGTLRLLTFPTSSGPNLTDWTGTVEFPAGGDNSKGDLTAIFKAWGNDKSTIKLDNVKGYLNKGETVKPVLNLAGTLEIVNGFSGADTKRPVLQKVTGAGTLALTWTPNGEFCIEIKELSDFTGILQGHAVRETPYIRINVEKYTVASPPSEGGRLFKASGDVTLQNLYIGLQRTTAYTKELKTVDNVSGFYVTGVNQAQLVRDVANEKISHYNIGTGIGKYTVSLNNEVYTDIDQIATAINNWTSSDEIPVTFTINQPTSGYYMLKSKYNEAKGYYLQCENQSDAKAKQTTTTDAKNIFYITVGKSNSSIESYVTGYYFGQNTYANYTGNNPNPVKWTFSEGSNKGTYTLTSDYSGSKILYGYSGENDKAYVDRNGSSDDNGHTDWILVPVAAKDLPVIVAPGSTDKNKKILGNIQKVEKVKDNITANTAFVDLSEATISSTNIDDIKGAVAEVNPNAIIIAPAGTTPGSATTNVLLKADEGKYTCNNLQLTDDVVAQFNTKYVFTTGTIVKYTRASSDNQWGTICLPYAVKTDGDVSYYRLVDPVSDTQKLRFVKVEEDATVANEPYLIKKGAGEGFVAGTTAVEEFSLGDDEVKSTEEHNTYKLQGVMVSTSVIDGGTAYPWAKPGYQQAVTDPNAYYFEASSNTFRKLNGRFNLKAFRAYLSTTDDTSNARSILGIDISEDGQSTGISFVESEDGKTVDVVFDLNGRRLQEAKKGINIINGKKVIK